MRVIKDLLRQHWPNVLAVAVFAGVVWRYFGLGDRRRDLAWIWIFVAVMGLGVSVASEVLTEFMDFWGGSYRRLSSRPAWLYRVVGAVLLAWSVIELFVLQSRR